MADYDAIEIGVLDESSDEDIVRKWLVQLDDLIVPESLEIIKLSLRSELKQVQLESIGSSADLCNALRGVYDNEQKILARIMYALKLLGHRRYGYYALRKLQRTVTLQLTEFDLSCLPTCIDRDKFYLCQHLATVCRVLPQENYERFIKHFAKQLEINHSTVKTPCEALVKMLLSDKISCENHEELIEEAMIKSHLSDDALKIYQTRCGEILSCRKLDSTQYASQCSSYTTLNTAFTSDDTESESTSELAPLVNDSDDDDQQASESMNTHSRLATSRSTADLRNRRRHQQTNNPPTSILHRRSVFDNFRDYCDQHCCIILCVIMIFVALFFIVAFFLMFGLITKFIVDYVDPATLYVSNTTVVVANSTKVLSLQVIQDAGFPGDDEHEINLYQVKAECNELMTWTDKYTEVGDNLAFINLTTTYAWTGSSITFHICGSTNQSTQFQRRLDTLIVKSLEDLQFTETILYNFYKGFYFLPGINGEWMCRDETVNVDDPDYYTIIFLPRSTADSFNYSVTYSIASVDLTQLQDPITATLYKDQDKWDAPQPSWFEYGFCVIAALKNTYNNSVRSHVHIRTRYNDAAAPGLGEAFIIGALMLGLLGTISICSVVIVCNCCSKKKNVTFFDDD